MKSRRFALLGTLFITVASACGARTDIPDPNRPSPSSGSGGSGGSDNPCSSVACDSPPPPACISDTTLRSSASPGACAGGLCSYANIDTVCQNGCTGASCNGTLNPLRIGAGNQHTCAVGATGAVKCWGNNQYGQLGNNTKVGSPVPVDVVGLASGVLSMSASYDRTCIVNSAGAVKCWGANESGELGNGAVGDSAVPVDVVGLSAGAVSVSAGYTHTCALTAAGAVKCWGKNEHGQLGNNTKKDSLVPVDAVGLPPGIVSVSAGKRNTCAVTSAGAVKCWGFNDNFGQLGDGDTEDSVFPVNVVGLSSGALGVFAGDEAPCAIVGAGAVKCWGWNYYGQLGDSTQLSSKVPVDVLGLSAGVVAVSPGFDHSCAITAAGGVQCWGWNLFGQLGAGPNVLGEAIPTDVVGLTSGVSSVSAGVEHTCALTTAGHVKCWGDNTSGQLGNNSDKGTDEPVDVVGF
jgi:alpha-tubulin suppressor-like RCC1 family protein